MIQTTNGRFNFIRVRSLSQNLLKKPTNVGFFHVVRGLRATKALRIIAIATTHAATNKVIKYRLLLVASLHPTLTLQNMGTLLETRIKVFPFAWLLADVPFDNFPPVAL